MPPALGFFGVAALVGAVLWAAVTIRRRSLARQPGITEDDLCSLDRAKQISSTAVAASLLGLAAVGVALLVR